MADEAQKSSKRVPTAVVLAVASIMVSIGVAAFFVNDASDSGEGADIPVGPVHVDVDTSTPEAAAESFLDAWRKRAHPDAIRLSVGSARSRAERRRDEEEAMIPADREMADLVWRQMAEGRLTLRINESERISDTRLILRGRGDGQFLKQPYSRDFSFTLEKRGQDWLVSDFDMGDAPERELDPSALPSPTKGTP